MEIMSTKSQAKGFPMGSHKAGSSLKIDWEVREEDGDFHIHLQADPAPYPLTSPSEGEISAP